ncbi:hypothetical protein D1872_344280 [compost metagenome]
MLDIHNDRGRAEVAKSAEGRIVLEKKHNYYGYFLGGNGGGRNSCLPDPKALD